MSFKTLHTKITNPKPLISSLWKYCLDHPLASLYVIFFALHILVSLGTGVFLVSDEGGYIGNAREFIYGYNYHSQSITYPGYSILLAPIFWITNDLEKAYPLIHILNAALMSFIPVFLYKITEAFAPKLPKLYKYMIAISVSLYPSYIVFSNLAMSEALFIPLFLLTVVLVFQLAQSPKKIKLWLCLIFSSLFLVLTHPRGFAVLPGLLLILAINLTTVLSQRKKITKILILFLVILLSTILLLMLPLKFFGSYSYNIDLILESYLVTNAFFNQLITITGSLIYLIFSTYGLIIPGLIFSISCLKKILICLKKRQPLSTQDHVIIYSLSTFIVTLVITTIKRNTELLSRGDYLLYGRYIEQIFAPLLILGIVKIAQKKIKKKHLIISIMTIFILILCFYITRKSFMDTHPINVLNMFGIYFYRILSLTWIFNLNIGIAVFTFLTLTLILAKKLGTKNFIILFATINLLLTSLIWFDYFYRGTIWREQQLQLLRPLREYISYNNEPSTEIYYIKGSLSIWHISAYEAYAPELKFIWAKEGISHNDTLLTTGDNLNTKGSGARIIGLENHTKLYFWLLPGENQSYFIQKGYILPEDFPSSLPDSAYRSKITPQFSDSISTTFLRKKLTVPVTIKHIGKDSLWPNSYGLGDTKSAVRIAIQILEKDTHTVLSEYIVDLPDSLYPGDVTFLHIPVQHDKLPDGHYIFTVGLVQEEIAFFSQKGDNTLHLKLQKNGNNVIVIK